MAQYYPDRDVKPDLVLVVLGEINRTSRIYYEYRKNIVIHIS